MKKNIFLAAFAGFYLMCGSAFAQNKVPFFTNEENVPIYEYVDPAGGFSNLDKGVRTTKTDLDRLKGQIGQLQNLLGKERKLRSGKNGKDGLAGDDQLNSIEKKLDALTEGKQEIVTKLEKIERTQTDHCGGDFSGNYPYVTLRAPAACLITDYPAL